MSELPDAEKVGKALQYLGDTDVRYAQQVARKSKVEDMKHHVIAMAKLASIEKSDAAKSTEAYASQAYLNWVEDHENAVAEERETWAHRKLAEWTIEIWRSTNANRRQAGQV